MKTISVRELQRNYEKYLGSEVNLAGWVKKIRAQKEFGFIALGDMGTGWSTQYKLVDLIGKYNIKKYMKI